MVQGRKMSWFDDCGLIWFIPTYVRAMFRWGFLFFFLFIFSCRDGYCDILWIYLDFYYAFYWLWWSTLRGRKRGTEWLSILRFSRPFRNPVCYVVDWRFVNRSIYLCLFSMILIRFDGLWRFRNITNRVGKGLKYSIQWTEAKLS